MFSKIFGFVIFAAGLSTPLFNQAMDNPNPPKKVPVLPKFSDSISAPDKALLMAAVAGNSEEVQNALYAGANLNVTSSIDGATALHLAVKNGHESVIKLLLDRQADIEAAAKDRCTPLHYAASNGHEVVVTILLGAHAYVNAVNEDGITPLHQAVSNGFEAVVKILLQAGADTRAEYTKTWTPLHIAAHLNYIGVVQILLEAGETQVYIVQEENSERPTNTNHAELALLRQYFPALLLPSKSS